MNKELKKIIGRVFTGLLFWSFYALYTTLKGGELEVIETLVLFEVSAIFTPYVIGFIHETVK